MNFIKNKIYNVFISKNFSLVLVVAALFSNIYLSNKSLISATYQKVWSLSKGCSHSGPSFLPRRRTRCVCTGEVLALETTVSTL